MGKSLVSCFFLTDGVHSFIILVFIDLNIFIKKRVTAKIQ